MLNWLVGGPVFAQANRVVGPYEDDGKFLQSSQANRGTHVIGEHQERSVVRAGETVEGHSVARKSCGKLTDTKVQIAAVLVAIERC